jgi:hypothetical protein
MHVAHLSVVASKCYIAKLTFVRDVCVGKAKQTVQAGYDAAQAQEALMACGQYSRSGGGQAAG